MKARAKNPKARKPRVKTRSKPGPSLLRYRGVQQPTEAFIRDIRSQMRKLKAPAVTVAESFGITRARFHDWQRRGRDDEAEGKGSIFSKLFVTTTALAASLEMDDASELGRSGDWRARLSRLERLSPGTWAAQKSGSANGAANGEWYPEAPPPWLVAESAREKEIAEMVKVAIDIWGEERGQEILLECALVRLREIASIPLHGHTRVSILPDDGIAADKGPEAPDPAAAVQ